MTESRAILITGASSGIGLATAHRMKLAGWQVYATARNLDDVEQLSANFSSWQLDVACATSVERTVAKVSRLGGVDVLFANAGFAIPGAVEDLPRAAWEESFQTNVIGTAHLVGLVTKMMQSRNISGRIIVNSSVLGFVSLPYRGAYVASKAALEGLVDTLRLELSGTGIQTCLLQPGPISATNFRINSLAKMQQYVDTNNSRHRLAYAKTLNRLADAKPLALSCSAHEVAEKVFKLTTSQTMPPRLRVTIPSHLNWWLKRLLPTRWMDQLLRAGPL